VSDSTVGIYSAPRREDAPLTPARIREKWDRSQRATRRVREVAAVNHAFLQSQMWLYWNRATERLEEMPREPTRVRASVARVGPDSRRILAKLMRRNLVFDVPPSSPDDAAIQAARLAEAALMQAQRSQHWEDVRTDHAYCTWEASVAGLCVEWDQRVGNPIGIDELGRPIGTGDVRVSTVSLHEIGCEPGTRDLEHALWWIRGVAMPPSEAKDIYNLPVEPKADARAVDTVWRVADGDVASLTPLTMVLTYYQRPSGTKPGVVMTVVDGQVVDGGEWPFPFDDRLNIAVARVEPIHGRWWGHTPVTDAVPVQTLLNASWSSIVEHMKLAGNARCWVPMGAIDDVEDLTDTPGEFIEYNPINGQKPNWDAPPTMPDWWIRQPEMLGAAMDDILSVHDVSRGDAPAGIESGIALSILSENDDTPVGALAKALAECWGRAATMCLKLWEANVAETRQATVYTNGIPEAISWSGGDLLGQTEAVVPLDAVLPRSRAAQAAYALQLYDRQIIRTPYELAKVADLPDQDDLLAGIDPDTARAQRENRWLTIGTPRTVDIIDDHQNHLKIHRDFQRSERWDYLPPQIQQMMRDHCQAHEMYAAGAAAEQVQALGVSPLAAMLPTQATKPIPTNDLATSQAAGMLVPQAGMTTGAPASPGQALGQPGSLPLDVEAEINAVGQGAGEGAPGPTPTPPLAGGTLPPAGGSAAPPPEETP
jgi:hypothetical protein